jgi:pimeloyl-ACP methyl ester carboxylesterase
MTQPFPDVVVLLPGLIGSALAKDGKPIWGTSPGALWSVLAGDALKQLTLTGPDNGDDDIGDGIVATGLIANPELIPGLWKEAGYSRLSQSIAATLHLTLNENFFEFPYDWRRDNRVSARKLARLAENWLARWRKSSGNGDAKLIFVAHSMGGLVARYYIECMDGWKLTRSLVTFGTPFRGSGNALDFLANGFKWKKGPFSLFDGSEALRSFESVYQLLPIYPFVHDGVKLVRPAETDIPNVDRARASAALAFHAEMTKAQSSNASIEAYHAAAPKVRPVVGIDQPTTQSARTTAVGVEISRLYEGQEVSGDGTVSRVSAFPIGHEENSVAYVSATHSALQSVANAHEHLQGVLTATTIDFNKFRSDLLSPGSISLHIPDAFDRAAPAEFKLRTSVNVQAVSALVERLDESREPWKPTLTRVGPNEYAAQLNLPAGLYRFSASPANFRPASDIFLVADAVAGQ